MSGSSQQPSAVTSGMPTHEALALLPIPGRLSEQQREGRVCVYDGDVLTTETAVDLGTRKDAEGHAIFPRACRTAASHAAAGALFDHTSGPDACPDCQENPICDLGRALNRIIRRRV